MAIQDWCAILLRPYGFRMAFGLPRDLRGSWDGLTDDLPLTANQPMVALRPPDCRPGAR